MSREEILSWAQTVASQAATERSLCAVSFSGVKLHLLLEQLPSPAIPEVIQDEVEAILTATDIYRAHAAARFCAAYFGNKLPEHKKTLQHL